MLQKMEKKFLVSEIIASELVSLNCLYQKLLTNWFLIKSIVLFGDNLRIPVQKQLSEKQKTLSQLFAAVLKSRIDFEHLEK